MKLLLAQTCCIQEPWSCTRLGLGVIIAFAVLEGKWLCLVDFALALALASPARPHTPTHTANSKRQSSTCATNHRYRQPIPWRIFSCAHLRPSLPLPLLPPPLRVCQLHLRLPSTASIWPAQHQSTPVHRPHPPQWTPRPMRRTGMAVRFLGARGHRASHRREKVEPRCRVLWTGALIDSLENIYTRPMRTKCADHAGKCTERPLAYWLTLLPLLLLPLLPPPLPCRWSPALSCLRCHPRCHSPHMTGRFVADRRAYGTWLLAG